MSDARIERRLAAILAADVVGFSALMERDEEGTYARVGRLRREVIEPRLSEHQGRLIKTTGDGFLVEFASPIAALRCALAIQGSSANTPDALRLRIGLNLGDVIIEEGGDVYGEGVNVAARLETLADPGGIFISGKIYSEVEGKVEAAFEDRGEQQVKNITRPVHIYAVRLAGAASPLAATIDAGKPLSLPDKPSIAVLPFQNMSGDPQQDYFADGLVEDIITALSRKRLLFVIARNSSFTYKGKAVDIKQVGHDLGVRYVLEGSVRKAANRIRITGQLIDAATGSHLWADRFDGDLQEIFELQDQMASSVVGAIIPHLDRAEMDRANRKPTASLEAYDYYLRGAAHVARYTKEANDAAFPLFQRAIELDPDFALAHAAAAQWYVQRRVWGWTVDRKKEAAEAVGFATRALKLSKDDPMILAYCGWTLTTCGQDPKRGAAYLEQAVHLDANFSSALIWAGYAKAFMGDHNAAIEYFRRALRLSPLDMRIHAIQGGLATSYFFLDRYEEALSWANAALLQKPDFPSALRISIASYAGLKRDAEAWRTWERLKNIYPNERISGLRERLSYSDQDVAKLANAFRAVGVPE